MGSRYRILGGLAGAALVSAVGIGTADGAEASTAAADSVPATSAPPAQPALATAGEFQCGPNNWIGGLVPENPPGGANFHPACIAHDQCYSSASTTDRRACDSTFLANMRYACDLAGKGWTCDGIAGTYYGAVRSVGWSFYKGSGANN